jgi:tetratricopeptide (TPR) repeat protein
MRLVAHQSIGGAYLSEAYLLAGRIDDAIHFAERALDLSRNHKERGHRAWALRLLGEIALRSDPPDVETAGGHYRQALALAEELGMRPLLAHCQRAIARRPAIIWPSPQRCTARWTCDSGWSRQRCVSRHRTWRTTYVHHNIGYHPSRT